MTPRGVNLIYTDLIYTAFADLKLYPSLKKLTSRNVLLSGSFASLQLFSFRIMSNMDVDML